MDVIEELREKTEGMSGDVVITLTTQQAKALLDQLEAERQQREAAEKERDRIDGRNAELNSTLERWSVERAENANEIEALRAALRGTQDPYAYALDTNGQCTYLTQYKCEAELRKKTHIGGTRVIELYARPTKPVVVLKSGYLHKSEVIKAIEGAGVVVKFETAGIVAGHNDKVDITCWSCRRFITFQQHAEADGFCPHCSVEIELDDKDGE